MSNKRDKEDMRKIDTLFENGIHYISGVGSATITWGWDEEEMDVDLFCIDGKTYGVFVDPDDGYRSYGVIQEMKGAKCQYTFEPQKVITEWIEEYDSDDYGWCQTNVKFLVVKDAILNKEVLRVGTDYTDDYYPMAIFHYNPMNLYENVRRSIELGNK